MMVSLSLPPLMGRARTPGAARMIDTIDIGSGTPALCVVAGRIADRPLC